MTTIDETTPHDPVEDLDSEAPKPFSSASVVDIFKQEARQLAENTDVYIPIKGYERTGLCAHYNLPESGKLLERIGDKVFRETKDNYLRNLYITMDIMAYLIDGLYIRNPDTSADDTPEYLLFDAKETGVPMTFDPDLAELLNLKTPQDQVEPTARQVIKALFGGNEMAIAHHGIVLNRWINDTTTDINTGFWNLGEL